MGLDRDSLVKVKSSQCVRTQRILYKGIGIDRIIIEFSKVFDLVPHALLFMKLAASSVDTRVVVWAREFYRVGRKLSKKVKVISIVPQISVLCQLRFLVEVNNIWRNIDWRIRLFLDD